MYGCAGSSLLLIAAASLVAEDRLWVPRLQDPQHTGSAFAVAGSGAPAQESWCGVLAAPWHVESSQTRD